MNADRFEEWRGERREAELEILQDRQQAGIGADEDATATRDEVVGMSQDQSFLNEGWPASADMPRHDTRACRDGPSR